MTMLIETRTHSTSRTAPARVLFAAVGALVELPRLWRNRRELARLGALTDRELADVGITRSDLLVASGSRWTEDPTRRLARAARENASRREMECRRSL